MKRNRIFHSLLSFILIMSMLSLPVRAADNEDASAIAAALSFDLLTTQSSYAVTKALDFAAANAFAAEQGAQIAWTSDHAALTISGDKALVTRGASAQSVTLAATVSKNGAAVQKAFQLTIPAVSTYVFESEGFGRSALVGQYVNQIGSRWAASTNNTSVYTASIQQNADGNYVLDCNHPVYCSNANAYTAYSFGEMPDTKKLAVSFTMMRTGDEAYSNASSQSEVYYDFYFNGETSADHTVENNTMQALRIKQNASAGTAWSGLAKSGTKYGQYPAVNVPSRFTFEFTFTETATLCSMWQDGTQVMKDEPRKVQLSRLDNFKFHVLRYGDAGRFYFDDFVITADKADMTAETLTGDDMGALTVKNYTAAGTYPTAKLDITSKYDQSSTLKQTIGVRSDTTNPHIDHYGAWLVDNQSGTAQKLSTQDEDDTAPFQINTLYIGANHGPLCVQLTAANHGKTAADIGSYWQDEDGKKWTLAQIVDANRLNFICDEFQSASGDWRHRFVMMSNAQTGTLTCLDEGSEATLAFTKQTYTQLYPAVKDRTQTVKTVTNGIETDITLGEAQEIQCDRVILEETYIITDPRNLPALLRAGKGTWTGDSGFALGEDMIRYHQTITVMEDGTVLTAYDHEILMDLTGISINYYGYQYYMKTDFGGGVKRYMPDTKAFTAANVNGTANDSFDFSTPRQMIAGSSFDYPSSAIPNASAFWADTQKAPNRMVDYMMNADGTTKMGFASGFLPVGDGEPTARLNAANASFYFYKSTKAYPIFINKNKNMQNATIRGISYRKYADTAKDGEDVQAYSVSCGNEVYYYIDFLSAATDKKLTLPDNFGTDVVEVDRAGDGVSYTISGNTISVSGAAKNYLVLKAACAGVEIRETQVNALGTVQAIAGNFGASREVTAVCAGYKDGKLVKAAVQPATLEKANTILTFGDFSEADTYKIFLWSGTDTLKPLCTGKTGTVN